VKEPIFIGGCILYSLIAGQSLSAQIIGSLPGNALDNGAVTVRHCLGDRVLAGDHIGPASDGLPSFYTASTSASGASARIGYLGPAVDGLLPACLMLAPMPQDPFALCPEAVSLPCDAMTAATLPYFQVEADLSANVTAGGFSTVNVTRVARLEIVEDFVITSPVPQMLELPLRVQGMLLGAESFGDPAQTFGTALVRIDGLAFGVPVSVGNQVTSVTTIPETATVDTELLVPLAVPAGTSVHSIDLAISASMVAQARGAFLIVGAATAQVANGDLRIDRFQVMGGGPLAAGTRIVGGLTGTVYEASAPVEDGFRLAPGCTPHNAVLYPTTSGAPLGGQFDLTLTSSLLSQGVSSLFFGLDGTDMFGCGPFSFGPEDLLFDLGVGLFGLSSASIQGGTAGFTVPVISDPAASGIELMFQTIDIGTAGSPGIELSTGLVVTLGS
jgi:hypothetical protein